MKTSVIDVHDMLSVLSVPGVEKRIGEVPGVESVTVNHAAGSATVRYDETRLHVSDIKSDVRQRGYDSADETSPTHAVEHKPAKTGAAQSPTQTSDAAAPLLAAVATNDAAPEASQTQTAVVSATPAAADGAAKLDVGPPPPAAGPSKEPSAEPTPIAPPC